MAVVTASYISTRRCPFGGRRDGAKSVLVERPPWSLPPEGLTTAFITTPTARMQMRLVV